MSARFDHVHIACSDIDAVARFLREAVDMKLTDRRISEGARHIELDGAGTRIFLRDRMPADSHGYDHIGFLVPNLEDSVADMLGRGATLHAAPTRLRPDFAYAYLDGPEGLRIELIERQQSERR